MDRTTFAACAVLALPLGVLGIGCNSKPASSSPSASPPAVLAELQRISPAVRRRSSAASTAVAVQLAEPPEVPQGLAGAGDRASDLPSQVVPSIMPPGQTQPEAAFPAQPSTSTGAASDGAAADSQAEEAGSTARFLVPSGGLDIDAPARADKEATKIKIHDSGVSLRQPRSSGKMSLTTPPPTGTTARAADSSSEAAKASAPAVDEDVSAPVAPRGSAGDQTAPIKPEAVAAPGSGAAAPAATPETVAEPAANPATTIDPAPAADPAVAPASPAMSMPATAEPSATAESSAPPETKQASSPKSGEPTPAGPTPTEPTPIVPPTVAAAPPPARTKPAENPAPRSVLPWANSGPRSTEMMAVVERADGRVLHGFQLAQRGALYSARAEFVAALQLIADANDAEQNTRMYSKALTAGLAALKEAGDFVRPNSTAAPIDVAHVSAGHKTPILKGAATGDITPLQAARRYYNYAQEQLAAAGAQETTSSMALFGVAKVAIGSAGNNKALQLERSAQAVALYQAALMTAPKNFLAANELGVLMAENGSLERAREMLMHSIALSPRAATWKNLAIVHGRLGETQLADRAKTEAAALERAGLGGSAPAVRWVDPDQFASIIPASDNVLPAVAPLKSPPSAVQPATEAPKPPGQTAKRSSDWLPWNSRR